MEELGTSEQLLFYALFYQSTPSCLKVIGGVVEGWGGGPCNYRVSPRSKSFFFFFWGTFIRLGSLLGQGLGPGLDNCRLLAT